MAAFKVDEIKKGNLGMISLISGIVAILLFFFNVFGFIISTLISFFCCAGCLLNLFICLTTLVSFIAAVAAIAVGIMALVSKNQKWKGMAIFGIILGIAYFVFWVIYIIVIFIFVGISTFANF
jgi:hypothetical protein